MANENGNDSSEVKPIIRPAILADEWTLYYYSSYIRKIMVGLTGEGCSAILVGPQGHETETVLYPSVDFIEHPEIKMRLFASKNRQLLLEKLSRSKPALLHGFWPGDMKLLSFLSEKLDIPAVATFFETPRKRHVASIPDSAILAASSEPIYQSIVSPDENLKSRTFCIPLGTFVEEESACFDTPNQTTSLVVCEELNHLHDYEPLLNAVRHLLAEGFEFSLAIMGQGPAERAIRKRISSLGLTYVVAVVPPLHPVRPVFLGMDVFIHIKDRHRCNLALMEAMSVGLTVAGCADSTMGLMQNEKTALLFDPIEEMSIYACLKQLLSKHELARTLAQNARQYLQAHHSVSQMVNGYIEAYTTALKTQTPAQE
jgi:glycosyltransferase involved in cell wall biosynthesis